MRVRLLGGLEIEGLDERALGSRKARTVLRRIAAALGRPVSYDELAAAAWGDALPAEPGRPAERPGQPIARGAGQRPRNHHDGGYRLDADWFDVADLEARTTEVAARLRSGQAASAFVVAAALPLVRGRLILVTLARAYPEGRYVGYDAVPANVERARRLAAEAGVDDRVRFEVSDVAAGLPGSFDVVLTFDVVHDAADPLALLRAIRQALRPGGRYVCLDINASDRVEDNVRPLGTIFYGFSVLYCMTSSLAVGGAVAGWDPTR